MSERTRSHMWRRMVLGALGLGLLGLPFPLAPSAPASAAGGPAYVTFRVEAARDGAAAVPYVTGVTKGDPITEFKWQINEDNIGDPAFSDANIAACMPQSAAEGALTGAAADGSDDVSACTWPSIRAIDGNSPVVANGDQDDIPGAGLELVDGQQYLVSITAPGFKIDGAHFTADATQNPLDVLVRMNPVPLPTVTVRVNVFNDNASTNGQYDGVSEDNSDMSGFTAHLNDIAGEVAFDVFGNPLCTRYETDVNGDVVLDGDGAPIMIDGSGGFLAGGVSGCISDASGQIVIPNLGPNRYAVTVSPPDPQTQSDIDNPWIQTTTLEGGHDWDTWNMEGATGLDTELVVGGEATPFVYFGYVKRNAAALGGTAHVTGRLMVGRTYVSQTGGLPNAGTIWGGGTSTVNEQPVEDGWVSLACLAGCPTLATDLAVYVNRANPDGTFDIPNVPNGTYSLTVWDEAQIRLLDFVQLTVRNGQSVDVGTFPLAGWFTDLDGSVFLDRNGNGKRDGVGTAQEEPGIPNFPLTLRTRVNTLQDQGAASASTDPEGHWSMAAYPLGQFLILEAYHPAYKTTGFTWKLNNEASSKTFLSSQVDWNVLNIFGLGGHFDVGVQPYGAKENGGIVGTVSYDVTRNELNPRNAAAEDWQPGVPGVTMQLWAPKKGADGSYLTYPNGAIKQFGLGGCERPAAEVGTTNISTCHPLDATDTEHWSRPTGCAARTADGKLGFNEAVPPYVPNSAQDAGDGSPCIEAPLMGVQFGTNGEVDGNYGFDVGNKTGDFLVEAVPPMDTAVLGSPASPRPLYKFTDEAAINVFTGDTYVPQDGWVGNGDPASDPGAPLATSRGYTENTSESGCAGALHMIDVNDVDNPDFNANGGSPHEGSMRAYCNVKLVKVQNRRSIAPIFHVYTDVPLPTRFVGYIIDDLNVSTDPKSTVFGEKAGMPNVPVGAYDYAGRLVYTAESDYNGYYEMLLPSTDTIACPTPSGVCPNVYRLVGNDPGQLGHPNLNYNPQYRTIGTEFQGWAGVVHPVDQAPSRVSASFQLPGSQVVYPPACAVPAAQPEFYAIDKPYWRKPASGNSPTYTITGKGFGADKGTLIIGANSYETLSWNDTTITFSLPASTPTGARQLRIVRADSGKSATNTLTFHVIGSGYSPRLIEVGDFTETTVGTSPKFNPANDPPTGGPRAIQRAIEYARGYSGNSLVVVYPNTAPQYAAFNPDGAYFENLVIHSRLKLQGVGPGAPGVLGSRIDGRYFWSVGADGTPAYQDYWQGLVEALPVAGNPTMSEGEVVYVRPETNNQFNGSSFPTSVDGFTITGGDQQGQPTNVNFVGGGPNGTPRQVNVEAQGGGVFLNAYANNTLITNNVFQSNGGTFGGAIRVGTPELGSAGLNPDSNNNNVRILNNRIVANGGTNLAGAIGIFYGSDDYRISGNDICGNASAEYGGGISHYGLSMRGMIDHNRVYFNQAYDEAGGIMVAGELPTSTTALSTGAGDVTIEENEVVANLSNDDGGGIRFLMAGGFTNAGQVHRMTVRNNIVADNVATHEGGGIAIDDTPDVRIVNNTIVKNITTATAMTSDGLPAPAGLSTGANSALLQARLNRMGGLSRRTKFSNPVLLNNVFWDNRAGTWTAAGVVGIGLTGDPSPVFKWDVGTNDGSGTPTLYGSVYDSAPSSATYHGGTGFNAVGNGNNPLSPGANPAGFVAPYDIKVSVASWRTFPGFRPAAIVTLDLPIQQLANYRLSTTRPVPDQIVDGGLGQATGASPFSPTTVPAATIDIDDGPRPAGPLHDVGADELGSAAVITAPLRLAAPATFLDRFQRASTLGSSTTGLGPNWANRRSATPSTCQVMRIASNRAQTNCAGAEIWNVTTFGATQEAGVTLSVLDGAPSISLVLKANGVVTNGDASSPDSFIEIRYVDGSQAVEVGYATGGTVTYLPPISVNFGNGDQMRARVKPNGDVEVFRNNVSIGIRSVSAWGPSLNAGGGQVGLRSNNNSTTISVDNFFGGNL